MSLTEGYSSTRVRKKKEGGKHVNILMGLNVHSNLLRMIRDGGKWGGDGYLCPTTYSLHCHRQNGSALRGQLCDTFYFFINCNNNNHHNG